MGQGDSPISDSRSKYPHTFCCTRSGMKCTCRSMMPGIPRSFRYPGIASSVSGGVRRLSCNSCGLAFLLTLYRHGLYHRSEVTKTPVHMRARHHTMGAIGLVIRLHVGTMWLPSLITGLIVDRIGPRLMTGTYRMTCIYP